MRPAQTYRNVTSIFSNNRHAYQPLTPLEGVVQVVQSKGSRPNRKLLLVSLIVAITFALSLLVSTIRFESMAQVFGLDVR
jgi:hypothetical protein